MQVARWIGRLARRPVADYLAALDNCLYPPSLGRVLAVVGSAVAAWWVYVPIHELLHAAGCLLTGGTVTRLDISPIYGAALLQRMFPFVAVGSDYAGQLVGFDTHGSDLIYLATDLAPYVLTVLVGVPLLRAAAAPTARSLGRGVQFGAAMPIAFAPFISLGGDYYEIGSILLTRLLSLADGKFAVARWRSDDVFKLAGALFGEAGDGTVADAVGLIGALLVGTACTLATYRLGGAVADGLRIRPD